MIKHLLNILIIVFCCASCTTANKQTSVDTSDINNYIVIAYINPLANHDHKLVSDALERKSIQSSIFGSVMYGVFVLKKDAEQALKVLKSDPSLKSVKIEYKLVGDKCH